jgi:hypothetical protein
MKHIIFSFALLVLTTSLRSQNSQLFNGVKQILLTRHPEVQLEDKLIAVNFWSVSDETSRKANAAFEKACSTYSVAKLKGGKKGLVVILLNKDNLDDLSVISLNKEGIKCCYSFKLSDLQKQSLSEPGNLVFNANGDLLFSNLSVDQIFSSIHSLITR